MDQFLRRRASSVVEVDEVERLDSTSLSETEAAPVMEGDEGTSEAQSEGIRKRKENFPPHEETYKKARTSEEALDMVVRRSERLKAIAANVAASYSVTFTNIDSSWLLHKGEC